MRVLMVFLDGVGIGARDPASNPLFAGEYPAFRRLAGDDLFHLQRREFQDRQTSLLSLDTTLGVPGLPQSGTGQTALFTGENAPRLIGRHFGPYPYSLLRPVIASQSIFSRLKSRGIAPALANAYPQRFFDHLARHPSRITVPPYACMEAGIPLYRAEDLARGVGISADITGAGWHVLGYPGTKVISHAVAGNRLVRLLEKHEFVLFEYWKTDHAGHAQDPDAASAALGALDGLLAGVLEKLDLRRDLLMITSDHGNFEDLRVKTHTRNPVPALLHGHRHQEMADRIRERSSGAPNLCAVTPALIDMLTQGSG